jgi:hypothetical protein
MFPKPAPSAGEKVWCMRCGKYVDVAEAPHNYTVRCETCSWGRELGNALITAETAAAGHATRRPRHRVVLADGGAEVRVYQHHPLPARVELPPF